MSILDEGEELLRVSILDEGEELLRVSILDEGEELLRVSILDEGEELLRVSIFDDGLLKSVLSEIVNIILNQIHTTGIPYPISKTLWQTLH